MHIAQGQFPKASCRDFTPEAFRSLQFPDRHLDGNFDGFGMAFNARC
jgi:hypothetical protein